MLVSASISRGEKKAFKASCRPDVITISPTAAHPAYLRHFTDNSYMQSLSSRFNRPLLEVQGLHFVGAVQEMKGKGWAL